MGLIDGLCRFSKITEAMGLFEEMKMRDCCPVVTYSSSIHGLYQSKNINEAIGLIEEMKIMTLSQMCLPTVFEWMVSARMDTLQKLWNYWRQWLASIVNPTQ